jgi:hypothetical protein
LLDIVVIDISGITSFVVVTIMRGDNHTNVVSGNTATVIAACGGRREETVGVAGGGYVAATSPACILHRSGSTSIFVRHGDGDDSLTLCRGLYSAVPSSKYCRNPTSVAWSWFVSEGHLLREGALASSRHFE